MGVQDHAAAARSFTPADLHLFSTVADAMRIVGRWLATERRQDHNTDYFAIYNSSFSGPILSLGRCRNGRYFAMDHRNGAVCFGDTLSELLGRVASRPADITA